jgi:processive 1,2-diacylglycerol beta-glucosyltransferase
VNATAPRVLVLSASYGSGHNAAARALEAALHAAGAQARMVDHFRELVHPTFDSWSRRLYNFLLYRASAPWALGYWIGDRLPASSGLVFGMSTLGTARLHALLDSFRPDVVVSTHPTPAGAMSDLRRRGLTRVPHALVYTDFTVHSQWLHPVVDLYCVPAERIRALLIARGVQPERVLATGLPVRPEFEEPADPMTARKALGLDLDRPVVLAMAGALGWTGRLSAAARVLRDLPLPLQAVVVAGRDQRLAERLRKMGRGTGRRMRVFGYTPEIRQLMAAADLLLTKAGGASLAEAIVCELPVICFGSLAGPERRNECFVVEAGAALRARSALELTSVVSHALTAPGALKALSQRMGEIRRPAAAHAVVDALLERLVGTQTTAVSRSDTERAARDGQLSR